MESNMHKELPLVVGVMLCMIARASRTIDVVLPLPAGWEG